MDSIQRYAFLSLLVTIGSAICWWPLAPTPNLELPLWLPLVVIALLMAIATGLSEGRWAGYIGCSALGTAVGLLSGLALWPPNDPLGAAYMPVAIWIAVLLVTPLSLAVGLIARKRTASAPRTRRVLWIALAACLLFGPATLAITPPLTARRVARTERVGEQRFMALKRATELAALENGGPGRACQNSSIRRHYDGPPFSAEQWRYILGNAVTQDRYVFSILCDPRGSYTIEAQPSRRKQDGTKRFCTDQSGIVRCRRESYSALSQDTCVPCDYEVPWTSREAPPGQECHHQSFLC